MQIIEQKDWQSWAQKNLHAPLLKWYQRYARELPWRNTKDPYAIWISEIILQQTRVAQGLSYYLRFMDRFPSVSDLASASEDEVLLYWQGLGYYSRARNLHHAAQEIQSLWKGVFPDTYKDILSLKGIGRYTAAAITSFAYNLPFATVDGNVYRVLSRLMAVSLAIDSSEGKSYFDDLANAILHPLSPALHNQAMMEIGALVCTPLSPSCNECPLENVCLSAKTGSWAQYPVKEKKVQIKKRYLHWFYIYDDSHCLIQQRTGNDIWKGLYQFPLIETVNNISEEELSFLIEQQLSIRKTISFDPLFSMKHLLTHRELYIQIYGINLSDLNISVGNWEKVSFESLSQYPFPRPMMLFWEKIGRC